MIHRGASTTHGLQLHEVESIVRAAVGWPEIEAMILFGSRAKGNHKKASDVDLAVRGSAVTEITVKRLSAKLNEELPLPYFFDVVHYESIGNPDLVEHINRVGTVIYQRSAD